jgi:TPR repeat protein
MRDLVGASLISLLLATTSSASPRGGAERAYARGEYELSARLFVSEAERGRATAQAYLGYQYQYGLGVPKSYEEAAIWYICAAEQGEPSAQFFLGQLYDRGQGVPEDPVEAEKWLDLAAAHAPRAKQDYWATMRDIVGGKMTLDELTEARRRAVAWFPSYDCPARSETEILHLPTHKYSRREADRER